MVFFDRGHKEVATDPRSLALLAATLVLGRTWVFADPIKKLQKILTENVKNRKSPKTYLLRYYVASFSLRHDGSTCNFIDLYVRRAVRYNVAL